MGSWACWDEHTINALTLKSFTFKQILTCGIHEDHKVVADGSYTLTTLNKIFSVWYTKNERIQLSINNLMQLSNIKCKLKH